MKTKDRITLIVFLALVLASWFLSFLIVRCPVAYAADKTYSDVLADLKKDQTFNVSNYPADPNDLHEYVITLGESEDKELFVYVYQPAADTTLLPATSINISQDINYALDVHNYKLKLLNRSGVFAKYLVQGVTVRGDSTRYYVVPSIFRKWVKGDAEASGGNTVDEVPTNISLKFCFGEINGNPFVEMTEDKTIVIPEDGKWVGFCRYPAGFMLYQSGACDAHFVAFRTDMPIDKLYKARVSFVNQSYQKETSLGFTVSETYGQEVPEEVNLEYTEKGTYSGVGLYGVTYEWDRIQSVEDFLKTEDRSHIFKHGLFNVEVESKLTDETKAELEGMEWVLRFKETPYSFVNTGNMGGTPTGTQVLQTIVEQVTILQLEFETDGHPYCLGVVDNKQTGNWQQPANQTTSKVTINPDWWRLLLMIVAVLAGIILLVKVIAWIWEGIRK